MTKKEKQARILKTLRPLIDGDSMVYRVGFACNDESEPVEFALHSIKITLEKVINKFTESEPALILISGQGNFRESVATLQEYKGNRKDKPKPLYYHEIREYMVRKWGAAVVDSREADDVLGETQVMSPPGTTCIVGQDKDLKTIPGWNYNYVTDTLTNISKDSSDLFLLWQIIQGDRSDNVPGLSGYGERKASKIITECNRDVSKVKEVITSLYKKEFGARWREVLHEVSQLLFIHREPGKTYEDYIGTW